MAIYQRDNINYGGMLGNAMANRANYLQRRYDRVAQMGQNWGNAVQQSGKTIQDALYKIAGNYYEQDKLAAQQQFQHDEALKRAEEQLARQREQEAWQAKQNELQRASTETIAELNRQNAREDRIAQNVMNYQNQEAIIKQLQFEYDNTSAKTPEGILKRAQLQSQIEQANNRLNYYGGLIPAGFRQQTQVGPTVITGPDAEAALTMFDTEAPKTAAQMTEDDKTFNERLKGKWTNANKQAALQLAGDNPVKLQQIANKGLTIEEAEAKSAAELKKYDSEFQKMSQMDQDIWLDNHPNFIRQNGHLARKKK